MAALDSFGRKAGLAFQIVDDVLDMTVDSAHLGKTAGKDLATEKATWPAVFGIEQSQRDAADLIEEAFAALEPYGEPRRWAEVGGAVPGGAEELETGSGVVVSHPRDRKKSREWGTGHCFCFYSLFPTPCSQLTC